jgi:hypothetical protein
MKGEEKDKGQKKDAYRERTVRQGMMLHWKLMIPYATSMDN